MSAAFFETLKRRFTSGWQDIFAVEYMTTPEQYAKMYTEEARDPEDDDFDDYEEPAFCDQRVVQRRLAPCLRGLRTGATTEE